MNKFTFYLTLFPIILFSYSNISNIASEQKKFYAYGDFLYWKTQEDGLDFIYDDRNTNANNNGLSGDIKRASFDWQSGFRIGLKYQFCDYNDWMLHGQYGYIEPESSQTLINPENKQIASTFQMPNNFTIQKAYTKIKISNHFANLLLQRNIANSQKFKLDFLSGLTALWIKRDWFLKFYNSDNYIRNINPTWHFKGVGLKTGLDFDWNIKNKFFWSGKTSIAPIFGNYDIWMKVYDLPTNTIFENVHMDDFRIVTNIQFLLGPSFQSSFKNSIFKIYANYEINVWLNLSQTNRSLYQTSSSNPQSRFTKNNLQMHGLTLYALINF